MVFSYGYHTLSVYNTLYIFYIHNDLPPETGASTNVTSFLRAKDATLFGTLGSTVLLSIRSDDFLIYLHH